MVQTCRSSVCPKSGVQSLGCPRLFSTGYRHVQVNRFCTGVLWMLIVYQSIAGDLLFPICYSLTPEPVSMFCNGSDLPWLMPQYLESAGQADWTWLLNATAIYIGNKRNNPRNSPENCFTTAKANSLHTFYSQGEQRNDTNFRKHELESAERFGYRKNLRATNEDVAYTPFSKLLK